MKKLLLFISTMLLFSIALLAPIQTNAETCSCGNKFCVYNKKTETSTKKVLKKYINKYIRKGKYRNYKIKFIKSDKLGGNMLRARKRKHIIYVEVITGYVMDEIYFDGLTSDGYGISYAYIDDNLKKGTCMRTYCIYNPATTYVDDIIYRGDRVVNTNKNVKQIRKAKKLYKKNFKTDY